MHQERSFYIDGRWVEPPGSETLDVLNPATEQTLGSIALGTADDVSRAVDAARRAFPEFSETSRGERIELLQRILECYEKHGDAIAETICDELGAPLGLARRAQASLGAAHVKSTLDVLRDYAFEEDHGSTRLVREPVGVCALITPWNWPINQIACKVAPALAAGCTVVLKPSEVTPFNAHLFAEVLHEAGVPHGVFNLVDGEGAVVGRELATHADVDMVSFTGSTLAGADVARSAATTIKRISQELGGKSANLLLDDADLSKAVPRGVSSCFLNSGQSCDAPTRMLVPHRLHDQAVELAREAAESHVTGDPRDPATRLGPLVSARQWDRVQSMIQRGIEEGARLVCGGPGRPDDLEHGYYARPTVFAGVDNGMSTAREEIFGPVLCILPYRDEAEAVEIANDSPYGLAAYVSSGDLERARQVASRLRAGQVHINGAGHDLAAPFGGYGQSGNGREWGRFGLEEFLELKALLGYAT